MDLDKASFSQKVLTIKTDNYNVYYIHQMLKVSDVCPATKTKSLTIMKSPLSSNSNFEY